MWVVVGSINYSSGILYCLKLYLMFWLFKSKYGFVNWGKENKKSKNNIEQWIYLAILWINGFLKDMKGSEYDNFRNDYFIFEVLLASFLIIKLQKIKTNQWEISLFIEKLGEISSKILNENPDFIQIIKERELLYKKHIKSGNLVELVDNLIDLVYSSQGRLNLKARSVYLNLGRYTMQHMFSYLIPSIVSWAEKACVMLKEWTIRIIED